MCDRQRPARVAVTALVAVWLIAVSCGMAALWNYEAAPGPPVEQPLNWPTSSSIARNISG